MKLKKWLVLLILTSVCFGVFAEDSYKLSVVSADSMKVNESLVTLEGKVVVSFKTNSEENAKTRELKADKVIIDIEHKQLDALGNVFLSEGKDSTFQGDAISLNWDSLDVVVFGGVSVSDRKGLQGKNVKFFIEGDRISYAGKNEAVFFQNGIIATREKNPYWSISAKKIGLAGSDIFFSNATLKLGRVPVFWLPVLFYPGNRLSFNPAIGFSSDKGAFLNTTYELYGSYPGLGASTTSDDTSETSALTGNLLSFLNTDTSDKEIRSGWTYIKMDEATELSDLQKWAFNSKSYFAVFADVWENYGFSLGFDTSNNLLDKKLKIASTGAIAYKIPETFRYVFDLNASYQLNNTSISLHIPVLSDPDVQSDLLNRNTVFGLDAALGSPQKFGKSYGSDIRTTSMVLNGSTNFKFGNYSFKFSSVKAQVDFNWNTLSKKYEIKDAVLPYISFTSSGTILDIKGKETSREEEVNFNSDTADYFYEKYGEIQDLSSESGQTNSFEGLKGYSGKKVDKTKTVVSPAGSFKLGYNYNQVIDNNYSDKFDHISFYTKIDSSVDLSGDVPGKWLNVKESINPVLNTTVKKENKSNTDFKLKSVLSAGIPKIGLTYSLKNYLYRYENTEVNEINRVGKWDKNDVLEHYLNINYKLSDFTFGLKYVLPPMDQSVIPKVSYSHNGLSTSVDCSFDIKEGFDVNPALLNANVSYSKDFISVSFKNKYDFKKKDYSGTESASFSFIDKRLKVSEEISLENKFKIKSMAIRLDFDKNYANLSFKDNDIKPDKLKLYLYNKMDPVYLWKNRIGFEGNYDLGFTYDFQNKYSSSLYADLGLTFSVNKFLDINLSVNSVNNSFYRYYEKDSSDKEYFSFGMLLKDLVRSFDFFGEGRTQTGFNLNSFSVNAVHYMEDWTLTLTSSSNIKTVDGKKKFIPEFSFLVKWNAIPELKSTNSWNSASGWDK